MYIFRHRYMCIFVKVTVYSQIVLNALPLSRHQNFCSSHPKAISTIGPRFYGRVQLAAKVLTSRRISCASSHVWRSLRVKLFFAILCKHYLNNPIQFRTETIPYRIINDLRIETSFCTKPLTEFRNEPDLNSAPKRVFMIYLHTCRHSLLIGVLAHLRLAINVSTFAYRHWCK